MCSVDKMLIKGIRSFSPDNTTPIEFYKPLTLIVGQNGAGKTTIIECLKQACTGELPPNVGRGQSFIHDPAVAGEAEIKAQIKLRMNTNADADSHMVVIRSYQLTQKKTKKEYKALDQTIQRYDCASGQKQALSYKLQEMDRMVPSLMGVSKAILENVIFVHQEVSNWPLGEPADIKKRFDDIFATTKYTKAQKQFKELIKEKMQQTKVLKAELEHVRTHKETAAKLRLDLANCEQTEAKRTARIDAINARMQEHMTKASALTEKLDQMASLCEQRDLLRQRHEVMVQRNADLIAAMTEGDLADSTEELEETAKELEDAIASKGAHTARLQREAETTERELVALEERHRGAIHAQGRLQADAEQHGRSVAERDAYMRRQAGTVGMHADALEREALSAASVASFERCLKDELAKEENALEELKERHREEAAATNARILDARAQIQSLDALLEGHRAALARNASATQRLEADAAAAAVPASARARAAADADAAREALAELEKEQAAADFAGQTAKQDEEVAKLKETLARLRTERAAAALHGEEASKLAMHREAVAALEERLESALPPPRKRELCALLGCGAEEMRPADLQTALSDRLKTAKQEAMHSRSAQSEAKSSHAAIMGLASQASEVLRALQQERGRKRDVVRRAIADAAVERAEGQEQAGLDANLEVDIENVESTIRSTADDIVVGKANLTMGRKMIKVAERKHQCYCCERPLDAPELEAFRARWQSRVENIPHEVEDWQARKEDLEAKLEGLKRVQPQWQRLQDLERTYIPEAEKKVNDLELQSEDAVAAVAETQSACTAAEALVTKVQRLLDETVRPLASIDAELARKRDDVAGLEARAAARGATGRSVSAIDRDISRCERDKAHVEEVREDLRRERTHADEGVAAARDRLRSAEDRLKDVDAKRQLADSLASRLAELAAEAESVRAEVAARSKGADLPKAELERLEKLRAEQQTRSESTQDARSKCVRTLRGIADTLAVKTSPVTRYEEEGGAEKLKEAGVSLAKLEDRCKEKAKELSEKQAAVADAGKSSAENMGMLRQINDCLQWRAESAKADKIADQLDELTARAQEVGDAGQLQRTYDEAMAARDELRSERDQLRGGLAQVQEEASRLRKELSDRRYVGVEGDYARAKVKQITTEKAAKDLDRYTKALEKTLLDFHTSKMADINKSIKELWQKTYRGQDIDHVEIKADADNSRSSYNYRVVMHAGGAELDMRGRCSAGQKVLASLIIRLALAENFCIHCGILALDEPTTNLDSANARSLAEALRAIIQTRREQQSFQLIVITHDEAFAQSIGTREYAEKMWRITKDEAQHSHVAQETIVE